MRLHQPLIISTALTFELLPLRIPLTLSHSPSFASFRPSLFYVLSSLTCAVHTVGGRADLDVRHVIALLCDAALSLFLSFLVRDSPSSLQRILTTTLITATGMTYYITCCRCTRTAGTFAQRA